MGACLVGVGNLDGLLSLLDTSVQAARICVELFKLLGSYKDFSTTFGASHGTASSIYRLSESPIQTPANFLTYAPSRLAFFRLSFFESLLQVGLNRCD